MYDNWKIEDVDIEILKEVVHSLPDKIFDIHAHITRPGIDIKKNQSIFSQGGKITPDVIRNWNKKILGYDKTIGMLTIPFVQPGYSPEDINSWAVEQVKNKKNIYTELFVTPDMNPDTVDGLINENKSIKGFKPYHTFSNKTPTDQSCIYEYAPKWCFSLADKYRLVVTLHIVKDKAISDPDNIREIKDICFKYPNAKLILAHAGRGFNYYNNSNLKEFRGFENIYFDVAAICQPQAVSRVLEEFGPKKLMWGSDFPVNMLRGKCIQTGDGFIWLDNSKIHPNYTNAKPALVAVESLRAVMEAFDEFGLNKKDLQDIFWNNAMNILNSEKNKTNVTQKTYNKAKNMIPGGVQLLSKRPEIMAPDQWPAYCSEARGCEVWDLDGVHYYDFTTNGIGSCLLGFANKEVTKAVKRRINLGSMSSLNYAGEYELANKLCEIHPWADQARFVRTGGAAGAVGVRISRATTDRSKIAICGYSGWHDWYIAANLGKSDALRGNLLPGLKPLGVPRELRGTCITFKFNDFDGFLKMMKHHGRELAAVVMEPCRYNDPDPGFLQMVRQETKKYDTLLIFDEITIGWRLCYGGAHLRFNVNPDIALFAKALGNGHPIGAIIGTKEAMEGAHESFISSTYWTEGVGYAAALATLNQMQKHKVWKHVKRIGNKVQSFWKTYAKKHNLDIVEVPDGYGCLAHMNFNHKLSVELKTLYTQLMLERGILASTAIYTTLAHTDDIIDIYRKAIDEVFGIIKKHLDNNTVKDALKGPVAQTGFARLNT